VAKDAHVDAEDKDGDTPLRAALMKSHFDIARLLIKHNADVNLN